MNAEPLCDDCNDSGRVALNVGTAPCPGCAAFRARLDPDHPLMLAAAENAARDGEPGGAFVPSAEDAAAMGRLLRAFRSGSL